MKCRHDWLRPKSEKYTGPYPYVCDHCGKQFSWSDFQPKFKCSHCGNESATQRSGDMCHACSKGIMKEIE